MGVLNAEQGALALEQRARETRADEHALRAQLSALACEKEQLVLKAKEDEAALRAQIDQLQYQSDQLQHRARAAEEALEKQLGVLELERQQRQRHADTAAQEGHVVHAVEHAVAPSGTVEAGAERFRDILRAAQNIRSEEERRIGSDGKPHSRRDFDADNSLGAWEAAEESDHPAWRLEECFEQHLNAAVAETVAPQEFLATSAGALAFMKAVGQEGSQSAEALESTEQAIAERLDAGGISRTLAKIIAARGVELVSSAAATGEALNEKFASGGGFEFDFGVKADFFRGLEDRIGPPTADILHAMVDEHCRGVDSTREWETGNYGITTTSRTELLLVLHEVFDQLRGDTGNIGASPEELSELEEWRRNSDRLEGLVSEFPRPPQWPAETKNAGHPRSTDRQQTWVLSLASRNKELREAGEKPLQLAEAVALCLYTGPLFEKYNAVCRGGPLQDSKASKVMRDRFLSLCGREVADVKRRRVSRQSTRQSVSYGGKETEVNRYTTTIHVLASALVKASKMSKAGKVWRGTTGGRLPKQFWEEDASGVKGGIEYGFMSTTMNREVAMQYASDPSRGAGTVLEIQTGMIDKGADLSWISQYPHERELCFPPLTSMQVLGTKVEGAVLVVSLRLNLNLTSLTIEEVIGKRRKVVQDMCLNLQMEAKRELEQRAESQSQSQRDPSSHDFERSILSELEKQLGTVCGNKADSFNDDVSFQRYLGEVLGLKRAAVQAATLLGDGWVEFAADAQTAGPAMRRLVAAEGPAEAQAALAVLEGLGDIQSRAKSTDTKARKGACEELARFAREGSAASAGSVQLLAELATDPVENVQQAAFEALPACCEKGGPELAARAVEVLAERAEKDEKSCVRWAACRALPACCAKGGPEVAPRAVEKLAELAKDKKADVRQAACQALPPCCEKVGPEVAARAVEVAAQLAKGVVWDELATATLAELAKGGDVGTAMCRALSACCAKGGLELAARAFEL